MITKEKGDIATGFAIQHFLSNGYEVCLPIGDKRDYDMVVEKTGLLFKVQVKYAGYYPSKDNRCKAALRITGGNQSFKSIKKYSDDAFDLLFVYTARGQKFVLPWKNVTARNELTIEHAKYAQYLVV